MNRRAFNTYLGSAASLAVVPVSIKNLASISMIKNNFKLKEGDTVGLIAPGSPIKEDKFDIAIKNMESIGLKPIYTQTVFAKEGYLAGDDDARLKDIHAMYANKNVKAIWCLRGGYGCTRLIPRLDYTLIKNNPKILIGYSDITALHNAIYKKTGITTYHGPVAISRPFTAYSEARIKDLFFSNKQLVDVPYIAQTEAEDHQEPYTIVPGTATGKLVGGNLVLLASLIGTPYAPSYKNKIVFIEDVGEKPYRIDRLLTQLTQATDIHKARGIILGVFSDCEAKEGEFSLTLKETLTRQFAKLGLPCMYGFTFGHVTDICTFPLGVEASMDAASFSLVINNS
jgi:muramoyltetrapeptide carboxypeptidase